MDPTAMKAADKEIKRRQRAALRNSNLGSRQQQLLYGTFDPSLLSTKKSLGNLDSTLDSFSGLEKSPVLKRTKYSNIFDDSHSLLDVNRK